MTAQELIVVADSYGLTSARLVATSAALLGLFGTVVGWLARVRARRGGAGVSGGVVAMVSGVIAACVGVLSLMTADGGPGTGNGVVGAYAAGMLGGLGMAFGGLAVVRACSVPSG